MPRELCSRQDQATPLAASPNAQAPRFGSFAEEMRYSGLEEKGNLHPYVQTLTVADVESCVALENAAFPEHERCSREKVHHAFSPFSLVHECTMPLAKFFISVAGFIDKVSFASVLVRGVRLSSFFGTI